jgi:hypothetical protein
VRRRDGLGTLGGDRRLSKGPERLFVLYSSWGTIRRFIIELLRIYRQNIYIIIYL